MNAVLAQGEKLGESFSSGESVSLALGQRKESFGVCTRALVSILPPAFPPQLSKEERILR